MAKRIRISSVRDLYRLRDEELLRLSRTVRFYHTIDLGRGLVIEGRYDHRPILPAYRLPDVAGMRVLDVGRASGFFSFLFERMGAAHVTAIDLPPRASKDMLRLTDDTMDCADDVGRLDFFLCHALLRSKVEPIWCDAADIDATTVGNGYDVAFVGSILVHLSDPISCLARIRRVLKPGGLCVIANPIGRWDHLLSYVIKRPFARLAPATRRTSCWIPNVPCLMEMPRRAGFSRVDLIARSVVVPRRGGRQSVRHAVIHARTATAD